MEEAAVAEEAVEVLAYGTELVADPALRVIGIWQDRCCCSYEYRRGFVVDVEDC